MDMSKSGTNTSLLDAEFDKVLVDMKPYVLKLPEKTDRQRCAVWIKKLCEPLEGDTLKKKNRNLYSQLMLKMLRRGSLLSPFDKKPEEGVLPNFSSYMSLHLDEPLDLHPVSSVPSWISRELTMGDSTGSSGFLTSSALNDGKRRPYSSLGLSLERSAPYSSREDLTSEFALDDISLTNKSSTREDRRTLPDVQSQRFSEKRIGDSEIEGDWTKPFLSHKQFGSSTLNSKQGSFADDSRSLKSSEIEARLKMLEIKFQEEKIKLQTKHDASVQKVIDRKNMEIENIKREYNDKVKELEDIVAKLDRKVQTLSKDSSLVRETKDKQITELKKMVDDTEEAHKYQYEKKLHDVITDFDQQKFEMQKQHTRNIQELLDETNIKLQRMEKEYGQQTTTTSTIIKDLENRVQQLTSEADNTLKQKAALDIEKNELQIKLDRASANLEDSKERFNILDREYKNSLENHKQEIKTLKTKTEASLEFIKQEQNLSSAKTTETICDLEQLNEQLKKSLQESEENRQRIIREKDQAYQQEKAHLENLHEKQLRCVKQELDDLEEDTRKKLKRLENTLRDKEEELNKLREQNRDQKSQADRAFEEFKIQVEKNQSRMHEDTKQQMTKVQNDLQKSKQSREKQAQEFAHQLEEERFQHDKELAELKIVFDNDKSQLIREFHGQKEFILSEHDRDIENLREGHRNEILSLEFKLKEQQDRDNKTIKELDTQVRELREEILQSNQLRKQQLVELGLLREEEKQKMQRDHDTELSRIRTTTEQQRIELQKQHSSEMEQMLQKTNDRLKHIEKENQEKNQRSNDALTSLQTTIDQLRTQLKTVKENGGRKLLDLEKEHEEEKKSIRKQFSATIQKMQHELDLHRNRVKSLEKKLHKEEAENEENVTQLKLSYEARIRGLVPLEVRQELEDTIEALKSQVTSLQQRAAVLQEDVDHKMKSHFNSLQNEPINVM